MWRVSALVSVLVMLLFSSCPARAPHADWLFTGGMVYDGSGADGRLADVAVTDGTIAAVGALDGWTAKRRIELDGRAIAPGFVDMHSHADLILLSPNAEMLLRNKLRQGVTTVVVGNCGLGPAPANADGARILAALNGWMTPDGVEAGALDFAAYLAAIEAAGPPVHVASLVPHGPLRVSERGLEGGAPSADALDRMRAALDDALDAGGFGLSFGLIYPPGMFSDTDELAALAERVAARDGLVALHVRGSSETLLDATDELLAVAGRSGVRVHHSHLEAVGEPFWPSIVDVLSREDAARAEGLDVSHDMFPYSRAATMMSAIFPPDALDGGVAALLERLSDPHERTRLSRDLETRIPEWPPWREGGWPHNLVSAVGWDGIRVASVGSGDAPDLTGRSLAELAARTGKPPFDLVADLMLQEGGNVGQWVDEISGREDAPGGLAELERILVHPAGAVVSDAEDYGRGSPHPAHAGAFARALRWNRERHLLPWGEMIRKMTAWPAERIGLPLRGRLAPGAPADLVVLDLDAVADRADWSRPRTAAAGVDWVFVGGHAVVEEGEYRGGAPGRVLRRGEGVDEHAHAP
ncbi:MAG: amidohydrolase family protein [Planctomycetota bacterium]|nr:amidohydrolase family protein [Planctomycetota bacterium]